MCAVMIAILYKSQHIPLRMIIAIEINIFVELGVVFVFSLIPAVLSNMFSCASAPAVDFSVIDDIVAYVHGEGSIRIIFTVYLLGIVLSAVISTFLLFGVYHLTKGSKVLSVLMTPILGYILFKVLCGYFWRYKCLYSKASI